MDNTFSTKFLPWLVVLTSALFFFFIFVQLTVFNTISPYFMKEFGFSAVQTGTIAAGYFYSVLLCFFPAGIILDRYSTKKVALAAVALATFATFGFSMANSFLTLLLCRLAIGVAGSFAFISSVKFATRWFPPQKMALVIGLIVTVGMLGGMAAQTPLTILAAHYGWRTAVMSSAALGIIFWLLIFTVTHNYPKHLEKKFLAEKKNAGGAAFWNNIWVAVKNRQTWLAGSYVSLLNLPLFLLGSMWGSMYLTQIHQLTQAEASYASSLFFVGAIIGSPLSGLISDLAKNRKKPMFAFTILSIAVLAAITFLSGLTLLALLALFFILGFLCGGQVIGYPVIAESNPDSVMGTANGIASILILGGGLMIPVFGWLMDLAGKPEMVNGSPVYNAHAFTAGMMLMFAGFVLSLIAISFTKETHCKPL